MKRVLLAFGFLWAALWLAYGLLLAGGHDVHVVATRELIRSNNLLAAWDSWAAWKASAVMHAHGLLLALIAILAGIAIPETGYGKNLREFSGVALIVGIVVYGVAGILDWQSAMGLAALLITTALCLLGIGFIVRKRPEG